MGEIVVCLRFGTGQKEELSGRRPSMSATVFLGSMYITNPLPLMHAVIRMSHMKWAMVKTMQSLVTFLETKMQQKVCMPKTSIILLQRHLGNSAESYSSR